MLRIHRHRRAPTVDVPHERRRGGATTAADAGAAAGAGAAASSPSAAASGAAAASVAGAASAPPPPRPSKREKKEPDSVGGGGGGAWAEQHAEDKPAEDRLPRKHDSSISRLVRLKEEVRRDRRVAARALEQRLQLRVGHLLAQRLPSGPHV